MLRQDFVISHGRKLSEMSFKKLKRAIKISRERQHLAVGNELIDTVTAGKITPPLACRKAETNKTQIKTKRGKVSAQLLIRETSTRRMRTVGKAEGKQLKGDE